MGGIILRYYLEKVGIPHIGRIVMMAPGNGGSSVLSFYKNLPFYKMILGPAGVQSADDKDCFSCKLPDTISAETGIIAGSVPYDPLSLFTNAWPQDGKVSVESTKIDNMKDHIILPIGHDLMMFDPIAIYQALHFLKYGRFNHQSVLTEISQDFSRELQ